MVRTPSTMLPLGTKAPDFSLVNVDGRTVSLADFDDAPALLVIFMCNHCPFVKHLADALAQFAAEYMAKGVAVVGINSNDVANYPADSPEQMVREAEERGYQFPVSVRRDAGSGQGVSRRLHARFLPVRSRSAARLSRPVRRQPAGQRHPDHRQRSAGRRRRRAGRQEAQRQAAAQHRLQHQVEAGNEPDYFG